MNMGPIVEWFGAVFIFFRNGWGYMLRIYA